MTVQAQRARHRRRPRIRWLTRGGRLARLGLLAHAAACAPASQMPPGPDWGRYALQRGDASGSAALAWRPELCAGASLQPDYRALDESNLLAFLREQQLSVRLERQPVQPGKPDLVFVFVQGAGARESIPLRVAILKTPDEAGASLSDALEQRGSGAWGVHRSNLAVLGPPGAVQDDLAFAAKTKLACWGTFTVADGRDLIVVPGAYAEP